LEAFSHAIKMMGSDVGLHDYGLNFKKGKRLFFQLLLQGQL